MYEATVRRSRECGELEMGDWESVRSIESHARFERGLEERGAMERGGMVSG